LQAGGVLKQTQFVAGGRLWRLSVAAELGEATAASTLFVIIGRHVQRLTVLFVVTTTELQ